MMVTQALEGKRLVGYTRVSDIRDREGDRLLSPDFQRKDILNYAGVLGAEVVEWREDLDRTGTKLDGRPSFLEAVELVEDRKVDGLIVAKVNRFARNSADAGAIVRRIEDAGGIFVSVAERLDPTPSGKFVRSMFFAMAELEADIIRENWLKARESAVKRGIPISPWIAAGFHKPAKRAPMVPHPKWAPLIVEAFERRANGQDCGRIADFLTRHGVPTSRGGEWTTSETKRMLERRIYIGELSHGDVKEEHEHLALVDRSTWEAVQAMVTPRVRKGQRRNYLLSGVLRCAGCGYALRPHTVSAAMVRKGSREGLWYYRCAGRHAAGRCPALANVNGPEVEALVVEEFFRLVGNMHATSAVDTSELRDAEAQLAEAESELAAFVSLESALGAGDAFVMGARSRQSNVDDARARLAAVRQQLGAGDLPAGAELRTAFEEWSPTKRRAMLTSVIGAVMARRMPRLTPVADRVKIIPRTELAKSGITVPGKGRPRLRSFAFVD